MVEENKQLASRIDGDIQSAQEDVSVLRGELADTNRRLEELAVAAAAPEPTDPDLVSSPQHAVTTETTSTPASNPSPSTSQQDEEASPEPEPVAGCSSDMHHALIRGGQSISLTLTVSNSITGIIGFHFISSYRGFFYNLI